MDAKLISKTKQSVKKYNDTYYQAHKAQILEKVNQKIVCDLCNRSTAKSNWSKHVKTDKHKLNMKIKELTQNI